MLSFKVCIFITFISAKYLLSPDFQHLLNFEIDYIQRGGMPFPPSREGTCHKTTRIIIVFLGSWYEIKCTCDCRYPWPLKVCLWAFLNHRLSYIKRASHKRRDVRNCWYQIWFAAIGRELRFGDGRGAGPKKSAGSFVIQKRIRAICSGSREPLSTASNAGDEL